MKLRKRCMVSNRGCMNIRSPDLFFRSLAKGETTCPESQRGRNEPAPEEARPDPAW